MKSRIILCVMLFARVSVFGDDDAINEWLAKQPIKVGEKTNDDVVFFGSDLTLMHFAAMDGRIDVIQWLKEKGERINAKCDDNGFTPMHMSAFGPRFIEFMRWSNDGRYTEDSMSMPISLMPRDCNLEAMKWFINQGVDINSKISDGSMIMHFAAYSGNLEAMKFAKDQGVDLNIKNNHGKTPLDFAHEMLEGTQQEAEQFQQRSESESFQNCSEDIILSGGIMIRAILQDIKECVKWLEENGAVSGEEE